MIKKLVAIVLVLVMVAAVLSGCGSPKSSKDSLSIVMGEEPETIDPAMNQSVDGGTYILHAFEGLTRIDKDGKTIPGIASKWEISPDGLNYTFHLRDAKWSDGQPVKAQDFEYAWKRALSPELASPYAYQVWYLKNGEEYNSGKAKAEDVGVKATDDKTLVVNLANPTPYFIDLMHFPTYMPVRKDIVDKYGDQWTQKPETYVTDGPYVMKSWTHTSVLVFEKSPTYWDKGSLAINTINWKLTSDNAAALSDFEAGNIDIDNRIFPPEETQNLISSGKAKVYPMVGTYYIYFNTAKDPFKDARVRQALSLAIDREYIVKNVTMAGELPADAIVPPLVPGQDAKKDFRAEGTSFIPKNGDVAKAKQLLADAGFPDGKGFPEVEAFYNTAGANKAIMEACMEMWNKNLGITIKTSNNEWKVLQARVNQKDFQMSRMGWIGDYNDPMTFLDMWTTTSSQNHTSWSSKAFDDDIAKAKASNDQGVRMPAMHDAEKIFLDELPAMPIYYYVTVLLENPNVKGFYMDTLGFLWLQHAYVQ